MHRSITFLLAALLVLKSCQSCSNFRLKSTTNYHFSARTNDQSGDLPRWKLISVPRNSSLRYGKQQHLVAKYGAVHAVPFVGHLALRFKSTAGLNEQGLSCDAQTLNELWSKYPVRERNETALSQDVLCVWALANFKSTREVAEAMKKVRFWKGYVDGIPGVGPGGEHYTIRDRQGDAIVIEFLEGRAVVMNETLGVVTNQPNYDWHKRNVKHLKWKMKRNKAAIALPGGFYPDDRLLRIYLLLEGLLPPKSYREAFMQTAHVLNSVTVPPGDFPGTDSPEGHTGGGPTLFAFIYDHDNAKLFWTDTMNQNWQLLDLSKLALGPGDTPLEFNFNEESSGWFNDITSTVMKANKQMSGQALVKLKL